MVAHRSRRVIVGTRGEEFREKLSRSIWAEDLLRTAINAVSQRVVAVRFGVAKAMPERRRKEHTAAIKRMRTHGKRPDVLLYDARWLSQQDNETQKRITQDLESLPDDECDDLVRRSAVAIECETSMWNIELMTKSTRRKPTVVVKTLDYPDLIAWAQFFEKPVYVLQLFMDRAYQISLRRLQNAIRRGRIRAERRYGVPFEAYYVEPPLAALAARLDPPAKIRASHSIDRSGRIRPHLEFHNATLRLQPLWMKELESCVSGGSATT